MCLFIGASANSVCFIYILVQHFMMIWCVQFVYIFIKFCCHIFGIYFIYFVDVPVCPERIIGYYSNYTKSPGLLEQIESSTVCSVFRCALKCLWNRFCYYIQYDIISGGCTTCTLLKIGFGDINPSNGEIFELEWQLSSTQTKHSN